MNDRSKVVRSEEFRWVGVPVLPYRDRPDRYQGVVRQVLIGGSGEDERLSFETRYFEVEPGGYSMLERHGHPHTVVVIRGAGTVQLEGADYAIRPFDCVYVEPDAAHQFRADRGEPLGFLCIVDRVRDRPRPADD
jgi:quercetin dioxygenase-like cupin family protein